MNQLRLAVDKQSRSQTFYSLSGPEREVMDISESLASDIIHPSSSPAGTGFFFVGKKYDSLRGMEALARRGRGSFLKKKLSRHHHTQLGDFFFSIIIIPLRFLF